MAKSPRTQDPGQGNEDRPDTRALADRIAQARRDKAARTAAETRQNGDMAGMAKGLRYATEFMAAIIVGGVLGYALDSVLGTSPWALIVLMMIGFAAGVLNVMRAAAEQNAASAQAGLTGPAPDDEDEEDDA